MGSNDKVLAMAVDKFEQQLAVLVRFSISSINEMRERNGLDPATFEQIETEFAEFHRLRQRPDFKDHMEAWFMGEDMSNLPELVSEAPDVVSSVEVNQDTSGIPEGYRVIGAEDHDNNGDQAEDSSPENV